MKQKEEKATLNKDKALDDLRFVADVIKQFEEARNDKKTPVLKAQIMIEAFLLFSSATLLFVELVTGGAITRDFYYSIQDTEFRKAGLVNLGITVSFGLLLMYAIAWFAWKKSELKFSAFLQKNFSYLAKLNVGIDFCTKFVALSLVIVSGKIEYVAPLLLVFQFDVLIQGKIFHLKLIQGIGLGFLALGLAFWMLWAHESSVAYPLAFFAASVMLSTLNTLKKLRSVI